MKQILREAAGLALAILAFTGGIAVIVRWFA